MKNIFGKNERFMVVVIVYLIFFFFSCTWAGRPCGIQNFTEIFTDYGLCFKFSPSSRKIKSGGEFQTLVIFSVFVIIF